MWYVYYYSFLSRLPLIDWNLAKSIIVIHVAYVRCTLHVDKRYNNIKRAQRVHGSAIEIIIILSRSIRPGTAQRKLAANN